MSHETARLIWRDDALPISERFDDPYYSLDNGLKETEYVFLVGTGIPERFRPDFVIAELGFGTGLNLLASLRAWERANISGQLTYVSFEAFPLELPDFERAHAQFPELLAYGALLRAAWPALLEVGCAVIGAAKLQLMIGDARQRVFDWNGAADAWFLDGFSPAKNPELWETDLLRAVYQRTAPGGIAATYSAAGHVRRGLAAAGFDVERIAGFGRKRHMTRARREGASYGV